MKSLKRLAKKKLGIIALASVIGLGCCSRIPQPQNIVYDREINGQRVVYLKGDSGIPPTPDQIRVYQNGKLEKVMEDFDRDGILLNNSSDSYTEMVSANVWVTYTQLYVTDPYQPYESYDKISTGKEPEIKLIWGPQRYDIGDKYDEKLRKAKELYKELKSKIQRELESKKIQKLISKISC